MKAEDAASRRTPPLATKERRFVAAARYTGCGVAFGDPNTLEGARRDAHKFRIEASGPNERRIGIYELVEVERGY